MPSSVQRLCMEMEGISAANLHDDNPRRLLPPVLHVPHPGPGAGGQVEKVGQLLGPLPSSKQDAVQPGRFIFNVGTGKSVG